MIKNHLDLKNPLQTQQYILDYWLPKINNKDQTDLFKKMFNYQDLIRDLNKLKEQFKKYRVLNKHLETLDKTIKKYQRQLRTLKKKL